MSLRNNAQIIENKKESLSHFLSQLLEKLSIVIVINKPN